MPKLKNKRADQPGKTKDQKMSTQKDKFELFSRLQSLGFTYDEAAQLRRIEMTLQRWGEAECGNERGGIERDDTTGKPYFVRHGSGMMNQVTRYPIADREAGALRRLATIMDGHKALVAYHQGDCRGCNLYILRKSDLNGAKIEQVYTRGVAVCA